MAKKRKCTLEELPDVVDEIIKEYGGEVGRNCDDFTKQLGRRGVQLIKEASKQNFKGKKYYKSWRCKIDKGHGEGVVAIIHNKMPGLPHLLEYSHRVGKTGQYIGRPHIAPVEERLVEEYKRGIKAKI